MKRPKNEYLHNFKGGMEGMVWPPVTSGIRAPLVSLLHELEETQWLPREKIIERQFAQLAELIAHAEKHSPHFRERLRKAGLTAAAAATPEGFSRLPPLTRRDLQAAGKSLYCAQIPKSHLPAGEVSTSGSTGEPVTVRKTALTHLVWMAMSFRDHFWYGHDFSNPLAVIRSSVKEQREHPDWGRPVSLLFDSGPALAIPTTTDIREQVRLLRAFRPRHLLAYPNNIAGIIDACEKQGETIAGLRHITTISETLTPGTRRRIEAFFGVKIEDLYSSSEMGNMALQCPESGLYHVMAENILLEVLDDEGRACAEGETGKVVVTDLLNFATPLIRYSINDYAEAGGPCPCGRGLPTVKRFLGRERNLVLLPDGTRFRPSFDPAKFEKIAPISQFQFIQHDPENLEVRLVTGRRPAAEEEAGWKTVIDDCFRHSFRLSFVYFDDRIPLPPSGKFEDFVCKI